MSVRILQRIKYLAIHTSLVSQPLSMSLSSLLSSLEVYMLTAITMPIRIELIQRLRKIYVYNIDYSVNVGITISRLKRISFIVPTIQLSLVSIYVHIFPMLRNYFYAIQRSSNIACVVICMLCCTICNIILSILWARLKCKTFESDDLTTEKMRYFAQNTSRIIHDKNDLDDVTMQMLVDQKLYGYSIASSYGMKALMQIQYLLLAIFLHKFYTSGHVIHIILLGMHQYNFIQALSNMIVSFEYIPSILHAPSLILNDHDKIELHEMSFENVFDRVSLTLEYKQYCLYGNNGIGKTIFGKLVTKQVMPTIGTINTPSKLIYLNAYSEVNTYQILSREPKLQKILNKKHLSKGEHNLLAIYSGLTTKPNLLVLDETLDSMDLYNLEIALRMLNDTRCIKVIITHNQDIIKRCRNFIQIKDRKIILK